MNKTLVVLNPVAGRGRAARAWEEVEKELRTAGVEFDLAETHKSLHAVQLGWEASDQGYERVVSVGGDGLAHEVLNGLLRASNEGVTIPLGIIPVGNGNDFVKMMPPACKIGENHDDWRLAVKRIAAGAVAHVDVGRLMGDKPAPGHIHPDYFLNGWDVGFGAFVAKDTLWTRKYLHGLPMYFASVMRTLMRYQVPHLRIELDQGRVYEQTSTMTMIANGRCFGGGFWVAPEARFDDGQFEVMISKGLSRSAVMGLIPRVMKGTHVTHPAVQMLQSTRVVIDSQEPLVVEADGEIPFLEARHIEAEILPGKLSLII
ncbi:MAG: diacylglycerol kinase family protein [Anaerolineae bacterium]